MTCNSMTSPQVLSEAGKVCDFQEQQISEKMSKCQKLWVFKHFKCALNEIKMDSSGFVIHVLSLSARDSKF